MSEKQSHRERRLLQANALAMTEQRKIMAQFTKLTSRVIPLPVNDIDTDQIIPARFLKATDKNGMGDNLFADWRYNSDGSPKAILF